MVSMCSQFTVYPASSGLRESRASIHIPAELPHAYTNTGHHRERLFVAPATDLAGFSAQSDLRTAGHVSAPEESPGAWRRILAQ